jgi:hypothetical protein
MNSIVWLQVFSISICIIYIGFGIFMKNEIKIKFMQRILGYLLVPVTLIAVTVLATSDKVINKVDSKAGSVEPRLKEIEIKQKEILNITSNLVKMIYVAIDACGRFDGAPAEHKTKIEEYKKEIKPYLEPGLDDSVSNDIRKLNDQINARNKAMK